MIIIAERINSSRKPIHDALLKGDFDFIKKEARLQKEAGAHYLDINCATLMDREAELMEKLVELIQKETSLPISIDSPNPAVLEKGLSVHQNEALVNSITGEKEKIQAIAPLVEKYRAKVVCLLLDEEGMPKTAGKRTEIARRVLGDLEKYHIAPERVFFDPLLRPLSTEPEQIKEFLEAVKIIKKDLGAKVTCGLSNISFGLPRRSLINSTFLAMASFCGLDSAILDPLDKKVIAAIKTSAALLGKDEYCLSFIKHFRK